MDKPRCRFGKPAVVVDNAVYHDSRRVRRYLKRNGGFAKLLFLPPYSPFLNPGEWFWRRGKTKIHGTFRRTAKNYFRRKVMLVYESFEIRFNPRDIPSKNLDKIFST